MVLVIVGIISVLVASRIPGALATSSSLRDSLLAQAQYARKAAIAQRRAIFVRIEATQSRLCYTAAGACDPVMGPTGDAFAVCFDRSNCAVAPPGLAVTSVTFQFDALGRPRDGAGTLLAAPLVITVTSEDARQFRVWNETGYAEML